MSKVIDGKKIRDQLLDSMAGRTTTESLTIVQVGNDPVSSKFIEQKMRAAMNLGIPFALQKVLGSISPLAAVSLMEKLTNEPTVGGIIVQLPIPDTVYEPMLSSLPAHKDVDVIGTAARKAFGQGRSVLLPPAVEVVKEILKDQQFDPGNKDVVVVGAGYVVGQPVYTYFKNRGVNATLIDEHDDHQPIGSADLVVTGVGKAGVIRPDELKAGAAVIDFGNEVVNGVVRGDLDTSNPTLLQKLSWYTPTPGGTGPILVAKIFTNFWKLV